jgi:hypothetical protein
LRCSPSTQLRRIGPALSRDATAIAAPAWPRHVVIDVRSRRVDPSIRSGSTWLGTAPRVSPQGVSAMKKQDSRKRPLALSRETIQQLNSDRLELGLVVGGRPPPLTIRTCVSFEFAC